jgi:Holliday junction DNA helicase RuvA
MISHIKGIILLKSDRFAIIDVSGVGYKVYISVDTMRNIGGKGKEISLWTHLAVREAALDLYGFTDYAEVELFEMLIGISGVGPKSALGIMGVAPLNTLKTAIASGDTSYLTKVSGIGKKNAEKIVLELRDKLGALYNEGVEGILKEESDAIDGLVSLGYSAAEAREALKSIPQKIAGTSERIKEALKHLGS